WSGQTAVRPSTARRRDAAHGRFPPGKRDGRAALRNQELTVVGDESQPGQGGELDGQAKLVLGPAGRASSSSETNHDPSAMANGLIGSREHYWLTSKVLSTAVRAHAIGSVTLRTSQRALGDRVCAGQRGCGGRGRS